MLQAGFTHLMGYAVVNCLLQITGKDFESSCDDLDTFELREGIVSILPTSFLEAFFCFPSLGGGTATGAPTSLSSPEQIHENVQNLFFCQITFYILLTEGKL